MPRTIDALKRAYEAAGVAFIDNNGGGRGVRFAAPVDEPDSEADDE